MADVARAELIALAGGTEDRRAVVAGAVAVFPLISEAGRAVAPGPVGSRDRAALPRGPGHLRRGKAVRNRHVQVAVAGLVAELGLEQVAVAAQLHVVESAIRGGGQVVPVDAHALVADLLAARVVPTASGGIGDCLAELVAERIHYRVDLVGVQIRRAAIASTHPEGPGQIRVDDLRSAERRLKVAVVAAERVRRTAVIGVGVKAAVYT